MNAHEIETLRIVFTDLCSQYAPPPLSPQMMWTEIKQAYSSPTRHYHKLPHIYQVYSSLKGLRNFIQDWPSMLFAVFYHDFIYDPSRHDNEARSAEIASTHLKAIRFPEQGIQQCAGLILATQSHQTIGSFDGALFLDADLSILGSSPAAYAQYRQQVRLEYQNFEDEQYKNGRIAVLQHFLEMEHIFKTAPFHDKMELQARKNIEKEIFDLENPYVY